MAAAATAPASHTAATDAGSTADSTPTGAACAAAAAPAADRCRPGMAASAAPYKPSEALVAIFVVNRARK